tara:strand:- start:267 stop:1187 length:921 start_codon:yes stop_codon:yes gene_type:complete
LFGKSKKAGSVTKTPSKDHVNIIFSGQRMSSNKKVEPMNDNSLLGLGKNQYKAIFISDVHLGSRSSQADKLLEFLQNSECEHLYMVGDIVDGWYMKHRLFWPEQHAKVMKYILQRANDKMKVTYVTGNHDEFLRHYSGIEMGCLELVDEAVYSSVNGNDFLVIHGDQYDVVTKYARWVSVIGDFGYNALVQLNRHVNKVRSMLGLKYWPVSSWIKDQVKNAVNFVGDFEKNLSRECAKRRFSGVICGHIHKAAIKDMQGFKYMNCGDWVESCTAILHHHDGTFEIYNHFTEAKQTVVPEVVFENAA